MFCKFCGNEIDENATFCSVCGNELTDNAKQTAEENKSVIYCKNCGNKNNDTDTFCRSCGEYIKDDALSKAIVKDKNDNSIGWNFLGFLFPLVGFILYLVWSKEEKTSSSGKAAGKGALVSLIFSAILWFLLLVIGLASAS